MRRRCIGKTTRTAIVTGGVLYGLSVLNGTADPARDMRAVVDLAGKVADAYAERKRAECTSMSHGIGAAPVVNHGERNTNIQMGQNRKSGGGGGL